MAGHTRQIRATGKPECLSTWSDGILKNNQKARQNPKALAQLDGYKRGPVNSLTGNLQRFGFERVAKVETLQEIIDEMGADSADREFRP